jgi:hypothetical protein
VDIRDYPMRSMFVRGAFALCPSCTEPVSVDQHVPQVGKGPHGPLYKVVCPCGFSFIHEPTREQHEAAIAYLGEVAADRLAKDKVTVPLSTEEKDLMEFVGELDQVGTAGDLIDLWG